MEILALGAELRREAEVQCSSINEAHFVVHEVLARAFADDASGVQTSATLRGALSSRVRHKLIENAIARRGTVPVGFATLLRQ